MVGSNPACRFGVPGSSLTTYGTVITPEDMSCMSPNMPLPIMGEIPFHLPISVSFSDPQYSKFILWTSLIS